nr:copper chaperone for superoxide dismutase, chloroplastic/cytosolic isoform X2 [Arachis hypogaea]
MNMAFLRTVATTTTTAIAASAIPAAFAFSSLSSSTSSSPSQSSKSPNSPFSLNPNRFGLFKTFAAPPSPLQMDHNTSSQNHHSSLPELLTEYMVDMKCEGCVNAVKNKLQTINDFLISAAVSEFKGPDIFGVVRLAQVNMELARIEANFSGLSPGKHGWSINEYGDLTRGAASTGKVYNPTDGEDAKQPLGDLGTLEANEKGEAFYTGVKEKLKVGDLIGRSVVVYATENKSEHGIAAAVIARSAGVGENYKKLCTCDGTTIWEASDRDFVTSKV